MHNKESKADNYHHKSMEKRQALTSVICKKENGQALDIHRLQKYTAVHQLATTPNKNNRKLKNKLLSKWLCRLPS